NLNYSTIELDYYNTTNSTNKPSFSTLQKQVYSYLSSKYPSTVTFANKTYLIKISLLVIITLIIESYSLLYGRNIIIGISIGILYAWIGLNIQHDANHNAFLRTSNSTTTNNNNSNINNIINRLLCYTQDYI